MDLRTRVTSHKVDFANVRRGDMLVYLPNGSDEASHVRYLDGPYYWRERCYAVARADETVTYANEDELFAAPIGMVGLLPVYVGDVLYSALYGGPVRVTSRFGDLITTESGATINIKYLTWDKPGAKPVGSSPLKESNIIGYAVMLATYGYLVPLEIVPNVELERFVFKTQADAEAQFPGARVFPLVAS